MFNNESHQGAWSMGWDVRDGVWCIWQGVLGGVIWVGFIGWEDNIILRI